MGLDIVYLAIGKMTRRLATLETGSRWRSGGRWATVFRPRRRATWSWSPAASARRRFWPWRASTSASVPMASPTATRARGPSKVTLCYGARTADYLAGVEDFRQLGVEVRISTDDGSAGHHGLVTDLLRPVLARVARAVPDRLLRPGADDGGDGRPRAPSWTVPCQVSLETPMACGIGICFSCVTKIRDASGEWDYRRTCVEGPVFDAGLIEF